MEILKSLFVIAALIFWGILMSGFFLGEMKKAKDTKSKAVWFVLWLIFGFPPLFGVILYPFLWADSLK